MIAKQLVNTNRKYSKANRSKESGEKLTIIFFLLALFFWKKTGFVFLTVRLSAITYVPHPTGIKLLRI
jgi:hypothetical protein